MIRRWASARFGALAAGLLLTSGAALLPTAPADAATTTVPTVTVAPRGGGLVAAGKPLDLEVVVRNTTAVALPAGGLSFSLDRGPVASATTLLEAIAHPVARLQGYLLTTRRTIAALDPGATAHVDVRVATAEVDDTFTAQSGTRIVYAQYEAGAVRTIAESAVTRMAKGFAGSVGLGTVLPLGAPENSTGIVDAAAQEVLAAPGGAWDEVLQAARADPAATVALDPQVPASIRLAGSTAAPTATAFLAALAALPNPFVELPYGDADLTLEHAAGVDALLTPSSFAGSSTAAAASGTATPTPTPTPAASERAAATTSELLDWHWSGPALSWPVGGTTTRSDLGLLAGGGRTVLLASGDVRDTDARVAAGPAVRVSGTGTRALVADSTASALLVRAAAGGPEGGAALADLVGVLGTDAVSGSAPSVLLAAGRDVDPHGLDRALAVLTGQSWIRGDSLTALGAGTVTSVGLARAETPAARVAAAEALVGGERKVRSLGRATRDPDALVGPERLALLGLLSARWRTDDAGWRTASAAGDARFAAFMKQVSIDTGGSAFYTGNEGTLAVNVVNELPTPVTVQVQGRSSNGRLLVTGDGKVTVTVPAGAQKPAKLPIKSISNGRTSVTVSLLTPDGTSIGNSTTRDITVQAGFEVIVAVALIAALGLLFLTGIYRNVVRQRRRLAKRRSTP